MKINKIPQHIWILLVITFFGLFLRVYQFHNWLDFGSDQVNDALRVGAVVEGKSTWPLLGPDMSNSGSGGRKNRFKLGPMYYYFEIISAKIFGNKPTSMAYPDLLFSILSIPLFYVLGEKYFSKNISLMLTTLYAFSFYSLSFSHSAWNVNSIPFFALLFLLSLFELLSKKNPSWKWIIAAGIALGVGVQLHAILLIIFPATAFFIFIFSLKKNLSVWKKIFVIILLALILNLGQLISELRTNFKNSKIFLYSLSVSNKTSKNNNLLIKLENNLSCNIETNTYILSSIGNGNCAFSFAIPFQKNIPKKNIEQLYHYKYILIMLLMLLFSFLGYVFLLKNFLKEQSLAKKYFLGLIILYATISFIVLLPVVDTAMRYSVHLIFLPFFFLGFFLDFFSKNFSQKTAIPATALLLFFSLAINLFSIKTAIAPLLEKNISDPNRIILGQIESMVNFMLKNSNENKDLYLLQEKTTDAYTKSLQYIATQNGSTIYRAKNLAEVPVGKPAFYLKLTMENNPKSLASDNKFKAHQNFTNIDLYLIDPAI